MPAVGSDEGDMLEPLLVAAVGGVAGRIANALGDWSRRRKTGEPRRRLSIRRQAVLLVANVVVYCLFFTVVSVLIDGHCPPWIPAAPWNLIGLLIATVITASLLFGLRTKYLATYASLEFLVGVLTAWFALAPLRVNGDMTLPHDPERVLKIVAAIYLMIRAMDNWSKAWEPKLALEANPAKSG
jgi:hypothetical protein